MRDSCPHEAGGCDVDVSVAVSRRSSPRPRPVRARVGRRGWRPSDGPEHCRCRSWPSRHDEPPPARPAPPTRPTGRSGAAGGRGGRQDCARRSATCCAGWASAARAAAHSRRRWPYPALVLLVSPVMVAVSGTAIHLRPNRPWLLIGVLAFHGLAEELVSRGYAFRGGARRDRHLQARRHPDSRAADLLAADHRRQPHHPATGPRPSATGPDAGTDTGSTP
jgi:hypothetical protein